MANYIVQSGDSLSKIAQKKGTTVAALLAANPGITNPNLIYSGASLNIPSGNPSPSGSPAAPQSQGTQTGQQQQQTADQDAYSSLKSFGLDDETINSIPKSMLPYFGALSTYMTGNYQNGVANQFVNATNFNDALKAAYDDPDIQAKYGDAMKFGEADLKQNLDYLNTAYNVAEARSAIEMRNEQDQFKEGEAAAGRGYSGFRNRAQGDLNTIQQGIITSRRSQLKNSLYNLGSGYEKMFGSKATDEFGNITAGGQSYDKLGGITGTAPLGQTQEAYQLALQKYKDLQLPFGSGEEF